MQCAIHAVCMYMHMSAGAEAGNVEHIKLIFLINQIGPCLHVFVFF